MAHGTKTALFVRSVLLFVQTRLPEHPINMYEGNASAIANAEKSSQLFEEHAH